MSTLVDRLREIMGEPLRHKADALFETFLLEQWSDLTDDDRDLAKSLFARDYRPAEIAEQLVDRIEERRMREAGTPLDALEREVITVAHENGGEFFLADRDPLRAEKREALVRLCDGGEPFFRRSGFRSGSEGGFFFQLTPRGTEVASVVCAS